MKQKTGKYGEYFPVIKSYREQFVLVLTSFTQQMYEKKINWNNTIIV
jgi:hypothetical protein